MDLTRGLFVLLMISSHAVGLAGVPPEAFIQSEWWLPRGWSTAGFVMLAGFGAGLVATRGHGIRTHTVLRRAWDLFVVMFVSNAIFVVCRELVHSTPAKLNDVAWLIGVLTFQRETTISSVLFPIVIGLLAISGLGVAHRRLHPAVLIGTIAALNVLAWSAQDLLAAAAHAPAALNGWVVAWVVSFPLMPIVCGALTGFVLGLVWRSLADSVQIHSAVVGPIALFVLFGVAPLATLAPRPLFLTLNGVVQFLTILLLALSLAALSRLTVFSNLLAALGRFSLMVFVLHRPLLQAADIWGRALHMPPINRYVLLMVVSLTGSAALCVARRESQALDTRMKRMLL